MQTGNLVDAEINKQVRSSIHDCMLLQQIWYLVCMKTNICHQKNWLTSENGLKMVLVGIVFLLLYETNVVKGK